MSEDVKILLCFVVLIGLRLNKVFIREVNVFYIY